MKRHILFIILLGLLPVLSMFLAPRFSVATSVGPLLTGSVKGIDTSLAQMRKLLDAGNLGELQKELRGVEARWQGMNDGLSIRRLSDASSVKDFERTLTEVGSAIASRNQSNIKAALGRSISAFNTVKYQLAQTVTASTTRIAVSTGGIVLLCLASVLAIARLSDRIGIKQ